MTEEERVQWALSKALTRPFSPDDMLRFLSSAGEDRTRAEKWLCNLDQLVTDGYTITALKLVMELMRQETEFVSATDDRMLN